MPDDFLVYQGDERKGEVAYLSEVINDARFAAVAHVDRREGNLCQLVDRGFVSWNFITYFHLTLIDGKGAIAVERSFQRRAAFGE